MGVCQQQADYSHRCFWLNRICRPLLHTYYVFSMSKPSDVRLHRSLTPQSHKGDVC